MSAQSEEIRKYFALHNIRIADVAEKVGLHPSSVSLMVAGKQELSKTFIAGLYKAYGFDTTYLLTGEGTLLPASRPAKASSDAELRATQDMVQGLTKDNISLKAKLYKLMEKLEALGLPCDDSPCKP